MKLMPFTPTRDRVNPALPTTSQRRPEWIKVRAPTGETIEWLQSLMRSKELHPCRKPHVNMGECWGSGTSPSDAG
jgi:lipoic acid synthetase